MALQYNLAKVYEISENDTEFALQIVTLFLEEVPAEMKSIKTAIEEKEEPNMPSRNNSVQKPQVNVPR